MLKPYLAEEDNVEISEEDYLKHVGILGMRWGQRKGSAGSSPNKKLSSRLASVMKSKLTSGRKKEFGKGQKIATGILAGVALISAAVFIKNVRNQNKINVDAIAKIINAAEQRKVIHLP